MTTTAAPLGAAYWRLWTSSGLSNLADGVVKVALPLVAIQYTRSPALVAGVAIALTLPWLLVALPAGALVDRLDRRRAMLAANTLRAAALGGLALAATVDLGGIAVLYAAALCVGVAETVYDTAAQSIVPQVVDRAALSRANGRLYAVELTANQFVGPPLAGVLVASAALAFAAPAALWAAAIAVLLLVRGSFRVERTGRTTMRADIAEGLRFLWRQRVLRVFAAMVGGFNFAANAAFSVLALWAVGPDSALRLSEAGFGVLLTATALGSLLGSFIAERVERALGRARALAVSWAAGSAMIGVLALSTTPLVVGAFSFLGGIGVVVSNVIMVSLRQRITPDALLGRVNSGFRLIAWGTMPLGAATGGVLAQELGFRGLFLVMGALVLALLVGLRWVTDSAMAEAERAAA